MQFTTAMIASAAAMVASAAPTEYYTAPAPAPAPAQRFGLITIRSGSPIQNAGVQASQRGLLVNLPKQNATCDSESNFATFFVQNGELNLNSPSDVPQVVYVDRSGMGQGNIGYITGDESLPRNAERDGWSVESDVLLFNGASLQACPNSIEGAWSLWLGTVQNPAFQEGCLGVIARTINTETPSVCRYTN